MQNCSVKFCCFTNAVMFQYLKCALKLACINRSHCSKIIIFALLYHMTRNKENKSFISAFTWSLNLTKGSSINDVTQIRQFSNPLPPSLRFLLVMPYYCRLKILDHPFPLKTVMSFIDDQKSIIMFFPTIKWLFKRH